MTNTKLRRASPPVATPRVVERMQTGNRQADEILRMAHEARFSYMSGSVVVLGLRGETETKRSVRIVKTRNSAHDLHVRSLEIGELGGRVL
jgi:hypothetical protein